MTDVQHPFRLSGNPRMAEHALCACGRTEAQHTTAPATMTRQRDIESERDLTRHAAAGVADPADLIEQAEFRAATLSGEYVLEPGLVALGRDRLHDAREELLDCRNHLVWWLQDDVESEHRQRVCAALREVVLAFELLRADA